MDKQPRIGVELEMAGRIIEDYIMRRFSLEFGSSAINLLFLVLNIFTVDSFSIVVYINSFRPIFTNIAEAKF